MASFRCFPEIWLALLWLRLCPNAFRGWKILQKGKRMKYYQQTNFTIFITMYWKGNKGERERLSQVKSDTESRPVFISGFFWSAFCIRTVLFPPCPPLERRLQRAHLIRNWWWLLSYGGAEQRDKAFRHLSLPVILLHLTWSPELAKANYLGQTISISKHSQQIAFHYWHARQPRKLLSTQRDQKKKSKWPNLDHTHPDATMAGYCIGLPTDLCQERPNHVLFVILVLLSQKVKAKQMD